MAEAPAGTAWRERHPVIGEKCTQCLVCTLYCPEGALVEKDGKINVVQSWCNGCGTCAAECPARAIAMVREYDGPPGVFPLKEGKA
jgi:2-oxoacid:acceptor oxidoreductase delta subunit (pyruvate/2-ketoisovalerate family)